MELKEFQLNAVKSLFEAMDKPTRDIILKSPTGSGKTIILTYFMHQYIQSFPKTVFVWLMPGKGNLEEQSKVKMVQYIHASQTKLLSDVMISGFEENDSCFINWEKLTKKGNNALKDSERMNFLGHIQNALNDGLRFVIIVDESHQNNTIKGEEKEQLLESIKSQGTIEPLIVRPSFPAGKYEIISGHRRMEACKELDIKNVPVIVRNLTDEQAAIAMADANLHRENILPSEKAFAYKMKLEAVKK